MLADELMGEDTSCHLLSEIGKKIAPIVRGKIMPLEVIMMEDETSADRMD